MNNPINRPANAPSNWVMNVVLEHGRVNYRYNLRGRPERVDDPCRCAQCIMFERPELTVGPPVQVHKSFPKELLEEKGYVGLYRE